MRRMIAQKFTNWIKSLFEKVHQEGNTTEFGGNIEVDGNLALNGLENIVDKEGHSIGKDLEDAVNGESTINLTITEDDWNEEEQAYVKHIEVNNCFIFLNEQVASEKKVIIYNPFFKGLLNAGIGIECLNEFEGLDETPENRFVAFTTGHITSFSIFNGNILLSVFVI